MFLPPYVTFFTASAPAYTFLVLPLSALQVAWKAPSFVRSVKNPFLLYLLFLRGCKTDPLSPLFCRRLAAHCSEVASLRKEKQSGTNNSVSFGEVVYFSPREAREGRMTRGPKIHKDDWAGTDNKIPHDLRQPQPFRDRRTIDPIVSARFTKVSLIRYFCILP